MAVTRAKKEEIVAEVKKTLQSAGIVFLVDFPGIKAAKINELRAALKKLGAKYRVVKKALLEIACKGLELDASRLAGHKGSVALITCEAHELEITKAIANFKKENDTIEVVGGFYGKYFLSKDHIVALFRIPSREALIAQLLSTLHAPMQGLVSVLNGNLKKFVLTLEAIKRSK